MIGVILTVTLPKLKPKSRTKEWLYKKYKRNIFNDTNIRNFIYILFFLFIYGCSDKDNSSYEMQDSNLSGSKELIVDFKTNLGEFSILLDETKAPKTVKNF